MEIKFYGSRGSMPFFSRENTCCGGNTACVVINTDGHTIVLDCGTGLAQFYSDIKAGIRQCGFSFDILISHLHLDHIIGLSTFPPISDKNNNIRIFTRSRDERLLASQIFGIFKPPYWPVDLEKTNASQLIEINDNDKFKLKKDILVTPFASTHKDGTTAFRIDSGKSVVYLLDYEVSGVLKESDPLVRFCKDADVVIFDSAYLPEDYENRRGWGHSTYESGLELAELSGCGKMILSHISHDYSDKALEPLVKKIDGQRFLLACDGMEVTL